MLSKLRTFAFLSLFIGTSAFAYLEKTYICKNNDGLPNNEYKITNVQIMSGTTLPYVEATRYSREVAGDASSPVRVFRFRGFASVHQIAEDRENLMVGQVVLQFKDNKLANCE